MGKKVNIMSYLYCIGLLLVVVGCFLPLSTSFGGNFNNNSAFSYITSKGKGIVKIGSILTILGAVAGIVFSFVAIKKAGLIKLVALIVSIAGGLYVFFSTSDAAKSALKTVGKITKSAPGIGLILIIAGWVVALVGWIMNRK
ncbi:MAG: hypothetical protein K6C97_07120 [Treponema sp.]|nr:hypothetical protein [Treponema sp.]